MKKTITALLAAAVCTGGLALSAPAYAYADEVEVFDFRFSYEKAELATQEGQTALLARLERSIRRECQPDGRLVGAASISGTKVCVERTMRSTVKKMKSEPLTALLEARARG